MSEAEGPVQGCSSTASVEMSSPAAVHSLQKFRSVKMDSLGSGNGNNNNYSNNNNNASNNEPRSPTSDRLASSYKNLKKFSNAAAELLEFRTRHRRRSNRLEDPYDEFDNERFFDSRDYRCCFSIFHAKIGTFICCTWILHEIVLGIIYLLTQMENSTQTGRIAMLIACRLLQLPSLALLYVGLWKYQPLLLLPFVFIQITIGSFVDISTFMLILEQLQKNDSLVFDGSLKWLNLALPLSIYGLLLMGLAWVLYKCFLFLRARRRHDQKRRIEKEMEQSDGGGGGRVSDPRESFLLQRSSSEHLLIVDEFSNPKADEGEVDEITLQNGSPQRFMVEENISMPHQSSDQQQNSTRQLLPSVNRVQSTSASGGSSGDRPSRSQSQHFRTNSDCHSTGATPTNSTLNQTLSAMMLNRLEFREQLALNNVRSSTMPPNRMNALAPLRNRFRHHRLRAPYPRSEKVLARNFSESIVQGSAYSLQDHLNRQRFSDMGGGITFSVTPINTAGSGAKIFQRNSDHGGTMGAHNHYHRNGSGDAGVSAASSSRFIVGDGTPNTSETGSAEQSSISDRSSAASSTQSLTLVEPPPPVTTQASHSASPPLRGNEGDDCNRQSAEDPTTPSANASATVTPASLFSSSEAK